MAEHTPSPWIKQTMEVSNADGQWVANFFNIEAFDDETMQANARLIAAAPDMLASLEMVWQQDPDMPDDTWIHIEMALSKARGEA